jgi:hypothetical protein
MHAKQRKLMIEIAAIAGPIIVLACTRLLMTPSSAGAQTIAPAALLPVAQGAGAGPSLNPDQRRAADWVKALDPGEKLESPLDHPKPAPVQVKRPVQEPVVHEAPRAPTEDPLAGVKLSSTMRSKDGGIASINGKVYRVGDDVRPGCKLITVDTAQNCVEIKTPDGKTVRIGRTR